ncbi:hypothetical protein VTI74DRAFT_10754 [Chaetomium olivicolor]
MGHSRPPASTSWNPSLCNRARDSVQDITSHSEAKKDLQNHNEESMEIGLLIRPESDILSRGTLPSWRHPITAGQGEWRVTCAAARRPWVQVRLVGRFSNQHHLWKLHPEALPLRQSGSWLPPLPCRKGHPSHTARRGAWKEPIPPWTTRQLKVAALNRALQVGSESYFLLPVAGMELGRVPSRKKSRPAVEVGSGLHRLDQAASDKSNLGPSSGQVEFGQPIPISHNMGCVAVHTISHASGHKAQGISPPG